MNLGRVWLGLFLAAVSMSAAPAEDDPEPAAAFAPTSAFETRAIEGWQVRVLRSFVADEPELADRTLAVLRLQLAQITRVVPEPALAQLRQVPIWVELAEPHHPCMCYHPAEGWLVEHGMNPDKARGVEIANARNFLDWTHAQPWMVLHELAHAFHHQFLPNGYENAELRDLHQAARASGRYDRVLHINGNVEPSYALNNPMEYFAEASEALFGTNDFYPFVRAELKRHDPALHDSLRRLWGLSGR
jgi:hypothetical protein